MKKKIDISKLSELQKRVVLEAGTEPPFNNEYWNHSQVGLYVDVLDGTPLFTSLTKFDAGCGWPSFAQPIVPEVVSEKRDLSHGMIRVEVRAKDSNAHLGHVFEDGPLNMGGKRYCMNSASLRFIKLEDLEKEGYQEYLKLFKR